MLCDRQFKHIQHSACLRKTQQWTFVPWIDTYQKSTDIPVCKLKIESNSQHIVIQKVPTVSDSRNGLQMCVLDFPLNDGVCPTIRPITNMSGLNITTTLSKIDFGTYIQVHINMITIILMCAYETRHTDHSRFFMHKF